MARSAQGHTIQQVVQPGIKCQCFLQDEDSEGTRGVSRWQEGRGQAGVCVLGGAQHGLTVERMGPERAEEER